MAEWTFQISAFFCGNQVAGSRHGFADNSIEAARQLCLKRALLVRIDPEENQRLEDYIPIGARPILRGELFGSGSVTQDSCFGCCCCVHVKDAMQGGPQPIYKWSYKL